MDSTLTMLLFAYAFGVPGFITDPLFDTSRERGHSRPLHLGDEDGRPGRRACPVPDPHAERQQRGVALEVEMRVGQEITCAKLVNLDTMLISTGKIIEITDFDDRGCRTQITTEVANAQNMLANWGGGVLDGDMMTLLHRVVFYGNHVERMRDLATLMGMKVVEEAC